MSGPLRRCSELGQQAVEGGSGDPQGAGDDGSGTAHGEDLGLVQQGEDGQAVLTGQTLHRTAALAHVRADDVLDALAPVLLEQWLRAGHGRCAERGQHRRGLLQRRAVEIDAQHRRSLPRLVTQDRADR